MRSRTQVVVGLLLMLGVPVALSPYGEGQAAVAMHGLEGAVKLEAPVEGFLQPLNGKLKLRATEIAFEPGGGLGDHLHVGPGIRLVLAGELTVTDAASGQEQRVAAGGYFYEAGDRSFRVENPAPQPARLLVVEVLPADWQGSAAVALGRRAELNQEGARLEKLLCPGR